MKGRFFELSKVRDPDALPILLAALETGGLVTTASIEALGRIGGEAAAHALGPFLDRDSLWTTNQQAIRRARPPSVRDPNVDPRWHWTAEQALVRMRLPAADDVLAAHDCAHGLALRHDDPAAEIVFRREFTPPTFIGTTELGLLADPRYIPQLRGAIPLADERTTYFLRLARFKCGDPDVIDDLRTVAAADPDISNRRQAAFLVGREERERRFT